MNPNKLDPQSTPRFPNTAAVISQNRKPDRFVLLTRMSNKWESSCEHTSHEGVRGYSAGSILFVGVYKVIQRRLEDGIVAKPNKCSPDDRRKPVDVLSRCPSKDEQPCRQKGPTDHHGR